MLRENGTVLSEASLVVDFSFLSVSFFITTELYRFKEAATQETWKHYFVMFLVYIIFWLIISKFTHLYQSRRFMTVIFELKHLVITHIFSFLFTLMVIFLSKSDYITNRFLFYFEIITLAFAIMIHLAVRLMVETLRMTGKNKKYILILGSGTAAHAYIDKLNKNPQLGYEAIGYLAPQRNGLEIPYLGNYDQIENVFKTKVVDVTVVTAPLSDDLVRECLDELDIMGKTVHILLDEIVSKVVRSRPVNFDGLYMVAYDGHPRSRPQEFIKRSLDVLCSFIGLIILSPLMLIVAFLIKLTSEGPVFFKQDRVGWNGRIFKMYKFRSMVINAEAMKENLAYLNEMSGPVFKITNDPRVTPIGRFIRKTSIDELPQLFNVWNGTMSLVGPRPPLPSEVKVYDIKHRKRLSVRPGITCTWQISGRNDVDFDEWMRMDAEYVEQWSFWSDTKILFKTIPAVLLRKGAK